MTGELLINVTHEESRVALLEGGQVVELYIERKRDTSLVGNIYRGKVLKILPGMQSSFIDIGLEKAAFLYVADIMTEMEDYYAAFLDSEIVEQELYSREELREESLSIEELIQEGQELLVQVSKEPIGTKGARVTSYVTLPGRYVVLMPNVEHIGISRRIEDEDARANLKVIASELKPKGFGLIMRTACEDATPDEIRRDMEFLLLLWDNIQKKKEKIERIELYEGREPMFDAFGIELDISRALGRKVWLKSGGYIVIDQTEAMTVIDVNTGKFVGKENLEDTILKTNIEAVKEIAYQIRLRNLGGIIITDFIDMEKLENREKVSKAFWEAMKKDRAKNTIYNISELGIIQMTRKRVRESLGRVLCEQCPYCEGRGFVKSARTVAYEIFRKVKKMNLGSGTMVMIKANPAVAELLSDEERQGVEEIESAYAIQLIIKDDIRFHLENYEITVL
ncbi:MAG: ribonuclease E/G [Nitrospirae bacterium]|nr:ribonuclease E/G [Nitrospirota bacterium]